MEESREVYLTAIVSDPERRRCQIFIEISRNECAVLLRSNVPGREKTN